MADLLKKKRKESKKSKSKNEASIVAQEDEEQVTEVKTQTHKDNFTMTDVRELDAIETHCRTGIEPHIDLNHIGFFATKRNFSKPKDMPSLKFLEQKANEIRINLSECGKYVLWKEVIGELFKRYKCSDIADLGLKRVDELQTVNELIRLQSKLDAFLICYDREMSFGTLFELERFICKYFEKTTFHDLYVGPLHANAIVKSIFNLAPDIRHVPAIKFNDLYEHFEDYLTQNNLWSSRIDAEAFEDYLLVKYNLDNKNKLGVRIKSIPLLIGSLKNFRRIDKETRIDVKDKFLKELIDKLETQRQWVLQKLNEKIIYLQTQFDMTNSFDSCVTLSTRARVANMNPLMIIDTLLSEFTLSVEQASSTKIRSLLSEIKRDHFTSKLFQLGLCFSHFTAYAFNDYKNLFKIVSFSDQSTFFIFLRNLFCQFIFECLNREAVEVLLNRIFKEKKLCVSIDEIGEKNLQKSIVYQQQNDRVNNLERYNDKIARNMPTYNELCEKFVETAETFCESTAALTLISLDKIEKQLLSHYNNNSFVEFGHGSFLKFVFDNQKKLEEIGFCVFSSKRKANAFAIGKRHFMSHLNQLYNQHVDRDEGCLKDAKIVESILLQYYSVSNLSELGYGSYEHLLKNISKNTESIFYEKSVNIIYEDSILDENLSSICVSEGNVDNLINLFEECPVLANIIEYTNWKSLYEHKYGNIKEFITKLNNQNKANFYFIETQPSTLLKLTSNTDIESLKNAIVEGDHLYSACHLVSLISINYGSMKKAPIKLLQNEISTAFSMRASKFNELETNDFISDVNFSKFYSFLVNFICCLPIKFASNCVNCFFIETLSKLEGSSKVVKEKLYKQCAYFEDEAKLQNLHELASSAQIKEFSAAFWPDMLIDRANRTKQNVKFIQIEKSEPDIDANTKPEQMIDGDLLPETNSTQTKPIEIDECLSKQIVSVLNSESINECKQHIEYIQREKYGIGLELNDNGKQIVDSFKGLIGRSLERLSKELYNEDMHFLLELIQNADDNNYTNLENFMEPTLIFLIDTNEVVLYNNEIGFSKENIEAISNVGGSTKKKHQKGYIGRKGIGFKSVFTVTDCPQIHSNGYHIKFDVRNGSIGYILPLWCDESEITRNHVTSSEINKELKTIEKYGNMNTCIELPLKSKSEMEKHKSRSLATSFNDIQHSLLLFLNRLKNLIIVQRTKNSKLAQRIYHRRDITENLIEIDSGFDKSRWLMKRISIQVPDNLKPSDYIDSTEICLAFPLDDNYEDEKSDSSLYEPLPKYDVFAYLPLRSFGFSFIIQADFEVPASRQDITQDSYWNQMLISQVPRIFVESLDLFKSNINFGSELAPIKQFMKFIPLEDETVGIFQNVAKQILKMLQNTEFLPILNETDDKTETVKVKKPFECVIVKDSFIRDVITPSLLSKHLALHYLHPSLCSNDINPRLLYNLGVRTLTIKEILEIFKAILASDDGKQVFNKTYMAKCLVVLKRCFESSSVQDDVEIYDKLKLIDFIPLLNGKYIRLQNNCIFFPDNLNRLKSNSEIEMDALIADLNIVDMKSLLCLDEICNAQIVSFLKDLGIKHIDESMIIESHILQVLNQNDVALEKDKAVLINYTMFIHNYWCKNQASFDIAQVRSKILLLTNQGILSPQSTQIYLTQQFGNQLDLQASFPTLNWCLIDDVYLKKSKNSTNNLKNLVLTWRKFFQLLGLCDIFNVEKRIKVLSSEEIATSCYSTNYEMLPPIKFNEVYIFHDYICPVLEHFFEHKNNKTINEQKLIEIFITLRFLIEKNWESAIDCKEKFSSFKYVGVYVSEKDKQQCSRTLSKDSKLFESQFYRRLKYEKWIVGTITTKSINDGLVYVAKKTDFFKPNEVYLALKDLMFLYGNEIPYASFYGIPYEHKKTNYLIEELGMKNEVILNEFLDLFKIWCNNDTSSPNSDKIFSLSHIKNVYEMLAIQMQKYNNYAVKQVIDTQPVIFIPNRLPIGQHRSDNDYLIGTFYSVDQVYYSDKTGLLNKYKLDDEPILLEKFYNEHKLKSILLNFGVNEHPRVEVLIDLLVKIQSEAMSQNVEFTKAAFDFYRVLEVFNDQLTENSDDNNSLNITSYFIPYIKQTVSWPCTHGKWASFEEHPLLVDDADLAEKFSDKLNFLYIPSSEHEKTELFSEKCNLKNLNLKLREFLHKFCELEYFSNVVELSAENITLNLRVAPQIQNICRKILPYIQYFLIHKKGFLNAYENFVALKYDELLPKMNFFSVKDVETVYYFKYSKQIRVIVSRKSCISRESGKLRYYVKAEMLNSEKDIILGFVECFDCKDVVLNKELIKFVKLVQPYISLELTVKDKIEIENEHDIKLQLGSTDKEWKIDEAVIIDHTSKNDDEKEETKEAKTSFTAGKSQYVSLKLAQNQQQLPSELVNPLVSFNSEETKSNKDDDANNINKEELQFNDNSKENKSYINSDNHHNSKPTSKTDKLDKPMNPKPIEKQDDKIITASKTDEIEEIPQEKKECKEQKQTSNSDFIDNIDTNTDDKATENVLTDNTDNAELNEMVKYDKRNNKPVQSNRANYIESNNFAEFNDVYYKQFDNESAGYGDFEQKLDLNKIKESSQFIEDEVFEDIEKMKGNWLEKLKGLIVNIEINTNESLKALGDYGEQWVFEMLKRKYESEINKNQVEVIWLNEGGEKGYPYDVAIKFHKDSEQDVVHYIEVKSTIDIDKKYFPVSLRQLMFATQNPNKFFIYRLYNINSCDPLQVKCKIIKDVANKINRHVINMFMVI